MSVSASMSAVSVSMSVSVPVPVPVSVCHLLVHCRLHLSRSSEEQDGWLI